MKLKPSSSHLLTEKCLCQLISTWVPFSNQERLRQGKEMDVLFLSFALPKIQLDSNSHCPCAQ